jgi:hypothetical protein
VERWQRFLVDGDSTHAWLDSDMTFGDVRRSARNNANGHNKERQTEAGDWGKPLALSPVAIVE